MRRYLLALVPLAALAGTAAFRLPPAPVAAPCDPDNAGLTLPKGYCAGVFATLPTVRHLAVAPNGDVFATSQNRTTPGLFALRDTDHDGRADTTVRINAIPATGVALAADGIYFSPPDRVIRYAWQSGRLTPSDTGTVIVRGLPTGGHTAKTLAVGKDGAIYVDLGSAGNVCAGGPQPGQPPVPETTECSELKTRAGIWRFDGRKPGQTAADGERWVAGFRNGMALAVEPATGALWGATHGRDELKRWPGYSEYDSAEKPAEEFGLLAKGSDYGWPHCYYDPLAKKKMLAPEYGGDNVKQGNCGSTTQPAIAFPGHWAPMQLAFNTGGRFGPDFGPGAFLAFHGSWNRAPLPQAGFRLVFIPFKDGKATGDYVTVATGSAGVTSIRPSGVAVMADGSALFMADENNGRILRIIPTPK